MGLEIGGWDSLLEEWGCRQAGAAFAFLQESPRGFVANGQAPTAESGCRKLELAMMIHVAAGRRTSNA